jgi:hypothetical protein
MFWKRKGPPRMFFPPSGQILPNVGGDELIPEEFYLGYLRGYRWWRVVNDGDGLCLASLHTDMVWESDMSAKCLPRMAGKSLTHATKAPDHHCSCGLYAQNPDHILREWERMTLGVASASGSILMSGRVVVCEKGFKAEHARIESPVFVDVACEDGCDLRPTRVELPQPWKSYTAWCPEHEPPMHVGFVSVDADVWLRHAVDDLNARYPTIEFISPSQLEVLDG